MRLSHLKTTALAFAVALGLLAFLTVPAARAQGIITGGITGTVMDQTGAVIPGASIQAKNEATGAILQTIANGQGAFQVADAPIGSYMVTVTAAGFGATTLSHVHVVAGNSTPLGKIALQPGKTAETVEVEGGAAQLINTESPQSETAIDTQQLATLPVSGAIDNATLMVPGVVMTHANAFSNTNGVNYSVNGQRGRSNNSEIDGQSNNDNSIGGPSFFFSDQDALQEVQVVTSDWMGAQYGRNTGGIVNYITKQGTNTLHGSGFEYYLGSWGSSLLASQKAPQYGFCTPGTSAADAANEGCTIPTTPRFVENLWGGTLGGPVLRNKLWFFGSTFWAHEYQSGSLDTSSGSLFPDATGLKQLQSDYPNNPGVAAMVSIGPYSIPGGSPAPVAGTTTNVLVTDGNTVNSIEMSQVGRYLEAHVLDQEELGRIDYDLDAKDHFYLRYDYQNNPWVPAWYLYTATVLAGGGYSDVNGIAHQVGSSWIRQFTPTLTNELRYSFSQTKIGFENGSLPSCTFTDLDTCTTTIALGSGDLGFGYGSAFPQGRVVKVNQVQDNASWMAGRHTLLFGGEYDYQNSPNFGLPNVAGNFDFGTDTGLSFNYPASSIAPGGSCLDSGGNNVCANGFSGLLQGIGTLGLANGKTVVPFTESDYALYFEDDYKVRPDMTLNLGLRYEYFGQSINLLNKESVAQQTGSSPFWNTSLPLSATTYPKSNPNYDNIEPRVGIAFMPPKLPKMVVHLSFAIDVDPAFYNIFLNSAQSAPLVNANTVDCSGNCLPSSNFTYPAIQSQDAGLLPTGGDPRVNPYTLVQKNFRNPMVETYALGIQYQVAPAAVMDVKYVGSHTFRQFQALNTNPDILDVQSGFPSYGSGISVCTNPSATGYTRPDCDYGLVETVGNTGFAIYNALQTSLTTREFHHMTGTVSYTYSREISNSSEIFNTYSGGNTNAFAQDPLNPDIGERGVDGNSYPNVWGVQMNFTDPWYTKQSGFLGRVLGGYFLNAFYQYNGGQPFSPFQSSSPTSTGFTIPSSDSAAVAAEVTSNFCDLGFAANFGAGGYISQCRPILANPSAPMSSVGINVGNGQYQNYVTGVSAPRSSFHWLWNNQAEALALGNPFPGVGRNTLRGDSWNDLDASVGKNFKATERVTVQLSMNVFNVLNRAYYGTPDPNLEDSTFSGFLTNTYQGYSAGTAAGGGAYYAGFGNRNIQLEAHISF